MSNDVEVKDTEAVEAVEIRHKRGKGRPAPGELKAGEIGINTSTREDDNTIHNIDDTWIRSQPRAWTADDDGKLHAIGGWDSLEKSAMYGDIPYSLTWEGESLGKTLPSWQHMLYDLNAFREGTEAWKDDLGEDWREIYYPIPNGGTIDDIDFNEYSSGRAALGVIPWHAEYDADVRVKEPKLQITARTCGAFNVDMEIHAKAIRLFTTSFQNNIPITVVEKLSGKPFYGVHDKPEGTYNEFKDSQTIINGPTSDEHYKKWDELVEGSEEYKECNTPLAYRTTSTAVLAVYGSSQVVAGGMRATHDEHPTEKIWGEDGKVTTYTPEGSMYFNTVTKKFMGYDGTQWIELGGGGASADPLETIDGGDYKTAQEFYDEQ